MLEWKYRPKDRRESAEQPQGQMQEIEEKSPEGFASRNVKTITFVICIAVFLVLFGPVSIIRLLHTDSGNSQKSGKQMTAEDAILLSELGAALTMRELQAYAGEISENRNRLNYYISFDHYIILGVEEKESGKLVVCMISDMESDETASLLAGNVRDFFERTMR